MTDAVDFKVNQGLVGIVFIGDHNLAGRITNDAHQALLDVGKHNVLVVQFDAQRLQQKRNIGTGDFNDGLLAVGRELEGIGEQVYPYLTEQGWVTCRRRQGFELEIKALSVFILAHAFYKAALFMVAGGITHETGGETSVDRLGGLRRAMPFTFVCAIVAGRAPARVVHETEGAICHAAGEAG